MRAQITKIATKTSKLTGKPAHLVCFKCDDGRSRTSWVDEGYRNFPRWAGKLKVGNILEDLNITNEKYIDADSFPKIVDSPETHTQALGATKIEVVSKELENEVLFNLEPLNKPNDNFGFNV